MFIVMDVTIMAIDYHFAYTDISFQCVFIEIVYPSMYCSGQENADNLKGVILVYCWARVQWKGD